MAICFNVCEKDLHLSQNGIVSVLPEDAKRIFYNDLSSTEADVIVAQLVPQSIGVYFSKATYAAWMEIPSTFLAGDADQSSITPETVEHMVAGARHIEPSAFDTVEHCTDGGHCLMISKPVWTADMIRRAAGEKF